MFLPIHWLIFSLLIGTALAIIIALSAWHRSYIRGNKVYSGLMLVLGGWGAAYALELGVQDMAVKLFWAKMQYFAIPMTGPMMLLFVSMFNGHKWPHKHRIVLAIFTIPLLSSLIIWVQPEWVWVTATSILVNGYEQYDFAYGFWGYLNIGHTWLMVSIAFFLMLKLVWTSPSLSRSEGVILLISILIPFGSNILQVFNVDLYAGYDFTPIFLVSFGLGAAWSLFEFRPYDLLPIAYHTAFENLPIPAILLDEKKRVRTVNPAAERHFSQHFSALNGCMLSELFPAAWVAVINSVEIKHTIVLELSSEKIGKLHHYDLHITPISDKHARRKGHLYIIQDITIAKRALLKLAEHGYELGKAVDERTAELQIVNQELVKAVQLKSEFLATISHELRTPLNAVIGTTESLLSGVYGTIATNQHTPLHRIEDSATHLLALISDILNVSKIEAGQFKLNFTSVPIVELSSSCLNLVITEAKRKNISIIESYDVQQEMLLVDERRLCQVLLNILTNAIKFTPNGSKIGLTVRDNSQLQKTIFEIWDNGIGIAPEDQSRIFDSFIQVDSSLARQYEGTGLGLALTRKLVELHGGTIEVQSKLGSGSRFIVMLPWVQE